MTTNLDTRWKQRFDSFSRAFETLKGAVELSKERELSDLERQGLIQAFEFTHELCWKTMKDFLESKGNSQIYGSKDTIKEAFSYGLIKQGELWMRMIESRNLSTHTYNVNIAESIVIAIIEDYYGLFADFQNTMNHLSKTK